MSNLIDNKKILWTIFLTIFIDMLGLGILFPIFPMLVLPGSPFRIVPIDCPTSTAYIIMGWLLACFPLAQFLCAPILGQLADSYGRKKVLVLSIMGSIIAYILFAYGIMSKNLTLLFVARIIDGASGGNMSIAQAVIGDISSKEHRAKNFGLIGMGYGLGFIFGPFIGGRLSDSQLVAWFNPSTPFWFIALIGMINLALVVFLLPETLVKYSNKVITYTRPLHNIIKAFSISGIKQVIPSAFLFNAGFAFYTTFWGIVLASQFHFSQKQIGDFYAYVGIMVIVAQFAFIRRMSGKIEDYKVLRISIFGASLCLLTYYFITPSYYYLIYFVPPFMAVFTASTLAFIAALLTRVCPANMRGEVMGINSSSNALSQIAPAVLGGYLAGYHAQIPVLMGMFAMLGSGLLFWYLFNPKEITHNASNG